MNERSADQRAAVAGQFLDKRELKYCDRSRHNCLHQAPEVTSSLWLEGRGDKPLPEWQ